MRNNWLRMSRLACSALFCWVILACKLFAGSDEMQAPAAPSTRTWALLVGVSHYPSLVPRMQLKGPENDVELTAALLRERFNVPDSQIVTLAESPETSRLPTRGNIETEFRKLAERAQAGDTVLILIAGHGSQQPDDPNNPDEREGLDEIFLPRDVGFWNRELGVVENAITDDEIRAWLAVIQQKGAAIFFIADTCHSGTIARGGSAIARDVGTGELGIPATAIAAAVQRAADVLPAEPASRGATEFSKTLFSRSIDTPAESSLVALYAAHPHELTYEELIPKHRGQQHGWLSWALNRALSETSSDRLTYRELAQRIHWHYQRQSWTNSHPLIEASEADLDREVLGHGQWLGRSRILLTKSKPGRYTINVGSLHEMTAGSVLAVIPDGSNESVGYVKVTETSQLKSIVEPVEFNGQVAVSGLPVPARCELKILDLGEYQVSVSVDVSAVADPNLQTNLQGILTQHLGSAAKKQDSLLRATPEGEFPDWYVVASPDGTLVEIVSFHDVRRDEKGLLPINDVPRFGPYALNERLSQTLVEEIGKVARARNLRNLAELTGVGDGTVRLDVQVERLVDKQRSQYRPLKGGTPDVYDADLLRMVIKNPTKSYVDVTLLYIQSDHKIDCFFPVGMELNRLGPGESHTVNGIRINVDTTGLEDLILIGVPATENGVPASFAFLKQPSLQEAGAERATRGNADFAWTSPLGRLTRGRMYDGSNNSRGASAETLESFTIRRFSWNVVKSVGN